MLIYWLSRLLLWFSQVQRVLLHLQTVIFILTFLREGFWIKALIALYFIALFFDTIDSVILKLTRFLFPMWSPALYFGRYIMGVFRNYTSFFTSSGGQPVKETFFYAPSTPVRPFTASFVNSEGFEWPLDTLETCLLVVMGIAMLVRISSVLYSRPFRLVPRVMQSRVWALSRIKQRYRRSKRFSPRLDSHEWQGVWDSMGKYLGQWAPPVLWNFTNEHVQNPEKLVEHLKEVCCHSGHTRDGQIMATCWGLAYAYRALFNTIQHLQKEKNAPGSEGGVMDSAATPAPSTAATPPPGTSTAATQTSVMDSTAAPATSTSATPPLLR